jgi:phage shock protein A
MDAISTSPVDVGNKFSRYWNTKEGKFGTVGMLVILGFLVYGFSLALPWVLWFATNVITLILTLTAGYLLLRILFSPNTWALYKIMVRKIAGWIINLDPIALLEEGIIEMRNRLQEFTGQRAKLKGAKRTVDAAIQQNEETIGNEQRRAQLAIRKNDIQQATVHNLEVERKTKRNIKYRAFAETILNLDVLLERVQNMLNLKVQDAINEVEDMKLDMKVTGDVAGAVGAAKAILSGNPSKQALFQQAYERAAAKIADNKGTIDQFIQDIQPLLAAQALDDEAAQDRAREMMKKWEQKLIEAPKVQIQNIPTPAREYAVVTPTNGENKYSELL